MQKMLVFRGNEFPRRSEVIQRGMRRSLKKIVADLLSKLQTFPVLPKLRKNLLNNVLRRVAVPHQIEGKVVKSLVMIAEKLFEFVVVWVRHDLAEGQYPEKWLFAKRRVSFHSN